MSEHGYESGRLNLPFVGHCTFGKQPICTDWDHIDAHLDFVAERHGVRYGHGNPLRRASETGHVVSMTQIGIRNVSSSNRSDYEAARRFGSRIVSVREFRRLGVAEVLKLIPTDKDIYVTIDIDGFDPSIAPGTGTPSHGGFLYYEVLELLQGLVKRGEVIGMDLVEVAPDYDPTRITCFLAAQLLMNFLGFIFQERFERPGKAQRAVSRR